MDRTPRRLVAVFVSLLAASGAHGQAPWPQRPVKIIAPFSPGGSADTLGRIAAQKLGDALKQSFLVENRPGAGGFIGSEIVAKAPPDGYTLVVSGIASHVLAPALSKAPFDPLRDFTHIALFGGPPTALVVHPDFPARTLAEFIGLAKARAEGIAYGSPGNGTHGHMVAEMLRQSLSLRLTHVPYKGAALAVADILAGHVPAGSFTLTTSGQQVRAGKLRALATTGERRLADYPDAPTFAELGHPELTSITWFGLSGPAGLPAEIVNTINAEVRKGFVAPDVREKLRTEAIEPNEMDARQYTAFVEREITRWTPIVRNAGGR